MNIEIEIEKNLKEINNLGFAKVLNLNTKQTSQILGVSAGTIENWRKKGIGIDHIKVAGRVLYPKLKIAEFQVYRNIIGA